MPERESFHGAPNAADGTARDGLTVALAGPVAIREALLRSMHTTPDGQARRTAEEAERARAAERAQAPVMPLTLDALLDKLGWSRVYAEHFVQPYCGCEDTRDGWERCVHARDLDLNPWT